MNNMNKAMNPMETGNPSLQLIFEKSVPGKRAWQLPKSTVPQYPIARMVDSRQLRATSPNLPELAEIDLVRHYTGLSRRSHGVDTGFYPLGSCTMKYNPKINEAVAEWKEFTRIHPLAPAKLSQGTLTIFKELEKGLAEITGMDRFTLQPAAGAHGEYTALLIVQAYHKSRGQTGRTKILVPTSAHGTNPASAAMAGFEAIPVNCNADGLVDLDHLRSLIGPNIAALMLTNPNTLGLFERDIAAIAELVHSCGGLLYYDGANLNAIMGLVRPGDMGFDLIHLNLHKTFATPHGGGGPGAGPVGVKSFLAGFLPVPLVEQGREGYYWDYDRPQSIGKIQGFYGNFLVLLKALMYIKALGGPGLTQVSRDAILNANYLRAQLHEAYQIPYDRPCMHEFVLSATNQKEYQVRALDIAKRLLDFGVHPPTIYFPLIVEEAMMIEPTETEDLQTLNRFTQIMLQIAREAAETPEIVREAPHSTSVNRLDEARAARTPILRFQPGQPDTGR
ncbi:MAG TPA: aminomethyl-transferring glycine dehydrogenase subunit GcvPB [Bacillota bacterium]